MSEASGMDGVKDVGPPRRTGCCAALSAMACAFVGDVAYPVRVETVRSSPLIVDGARKAKPALDRAFSLRPGFIESPTKLRPRTV